MTPTRKDLFTSLSTPHDVLILGGGATGLGIAVDAATRGYKTALVEAGDFAQAISSRSTKLVHGGLATSPPGRSTSSAKPSTSAPTLASWLN